MAISDLEQGVWFVYDGACTLCSQAAMALRIKAKYGSLHLLDARAQKEHVLIKEINSRNLDLDEGMVIYHQGDFYHGASALRFMAQFSQAKGWFNWSNKLLFWSKSMAKVLYPWMRGVRNSLLRRKGGVRIDNLNRQSQAVFEMVFAEQWQQLPAVLKKHYQVRAYSAEQVTFKGTMNIKSRGPIKWLSPMLWLMQGIPPKTQDDVPVSVSFISQADELALQFDRQFCFKANKPYRFKSKLYPQAAGQVIEVMKFGITWKMQLLWDQDRIKMRHQGYALKWFGHLIPMPLTWLFGAGYAEEVAVDDASFDMRVTINHAWWGEIYSYQGRFTYLN